MPASRYKETSPASDEKRDGSNSLPANFMPTQFQAYLSQLNFDPSAGMYEGQTLKFKYCKLYAMIFYDCLVGCQSTGK